MRREYVICARCARSHVQVDAGAGGRVERQRFGSGAQCTLCIPFGVRRALRRRINTPLCIEWLSTTT